MGGATWQRHRKFLKQALSPNTVKEQYSDLFIAKASRYLQTLLRQPEDFYPALKRFVPGLNFPPLEAELVLQGTRRDDRGTNIRRTWGRKRSRLCNKTGRVLCLHQASLNGLFCRSLPSP